MSINNDSYWNYLSIQQMIKPESTFTELLGGSNKQKQRELKVLWLRSYCTAVQLLPYKPK